MAQILRFIPPSSGSATHSGSCRIISWPQAAVVTTAAPKAPKQPKPRKRGDSRQEEHRRDMLAKIHMAVGDLSSKLEHFDKDFYLDHIDKLFDLSGKFGRVSSADLTHDQRHQVLLWLYSLGFRAKNGRHRQAAPKAFYKDGSGLAREERLHKIEALLAEKGRVEGTDMPWKYAEAILERMTKGGKKNLDAASCKQLDNIIAALWRDARRRGRRIS